MAAKNKEFFWRLYLLLYEGCPLISRELISKEIAKSGYDLDRLLMDNKKHLERKYRLSDDDINILFPGNKKTDIEHWGAHLFPCVILELCSKSLKTFERKHMRNILNVQKDIEDSLPEVSLDPETYDEYKETLSEALLSLAHAVSEQVENEISDLMNAFLMQPLCIRTVTGIHLPEEIKEKLLHFLDSFPSNRETVNLETQSQMAVNKEGNKSSSVFEEIKKNVIYERIQAKQPLAHGNTCINVHETQNSTTQDSKNLENDILEFVNDLSATGAECLSSEDELDKGSDEIVAYASKPLTDLERKSTELFWKDKAFEQALKDKSFAGAYDKKMDEWEQEYVNVAVLGRTGVGKSRFINAFRDCTSSEDSSFAPVGSDETTFEAKAYPHPRNKRLILWDLPGMGTKMFSRKTYVKDKKVSFQNYHIYLIMASDRFTEDDIYLAKEIEKIGKTFLFVRTRVDINLDNVTDVKCEIKKIRDYCSKSLSDEGFASSEVYLISSKYAKHPHLDFDQLLERLVESLEGLKKEVVLYSLQFNTNIFIDNKAAALQSRFKYIILKSLFGGLPLPGFSLCVDLVLISNELDFYRETLGVTDGDLRNLAEKTNKTVDDLKVEYKLKTFYVFKPTKDVDKLRNHYLQLLLRISESEAVLSTTNLFPGNDSLFISGISWATTYHFLKSNIGMMVEDAKTMMSILLK